MLEVEYKLEPMVVAERHRHGCRSVLRGNSHHPRNQLGCETIWAERSQRERIGSRTVRMAREEDQDVKRLVGYFGARDPRRDGAIYLGLIVRRDGEKSNLAHLEHPLLLVGVGVMDGYQVVEIQGHPPHEVLPPALVPELDWIHWDPSLP